MDSVVLKEGNETTTESRLILSGGFIQSGVTVEVLVQARNSSTGEDVCDPAMDTITIPGSECSLTEQPSVEVFSHILHVFTHMIITIMCVGNTMTK